MNPPEEPRKEQGDSKMRMENLSLVINSGRQGSIMPPESTTIILNEIIKALTQPNIVIVGIYGTNDANRKNTVEKVSRRVERDELFNVILKTSMMKKVDLKRIQGELGDALGLQLHEKTLEKRATRLCERIKMEDKILIILDDLQGEINLANIGIPFGNDHKGCKILLVAQNKDVLSDKMKTQKEFFVDELTRSRRARACARVINSGRHGNIMPPKSTTRILNEIITALTQPNIVIVGIYGSSTANRENAVEKVSRRVKRDGLFNVILKTSVMKKVDLKKIQGELGNALGLQLQEKTLEERATRLCERIKMEDKILIILDHLQAEINLTNIGIPFGNDHKCCKILLVAQNKEVLSDKMKTQKEFSVDN